MPVVMSYQAVNQLGALAKQSGSALGRAEAQSQRLGLAMDRQAQMDQTALGLQELEQQQRQFQQGLAFDRQQAQADRAMEQQQWQQEMNLAQQQARADIQEAQIDRDARLRQQQLEHQQRMRQEQLRGLYDLQEQRIRQQGEADPYGRGPAGAQVGMPSEDFAQSEMQQFGHLLPWQQNLTHANAAAGNRERVIKQAQALSQLPTSELKRLIDQGQAGEYQPYLRAVVQARQKLGDGQRAGPVGAMPEGGSAPSGGQAGGPQPGPQQPRQPQQPQRPDRGGQQATGGLSGGGEGYGNRIQQLSDEELRAIANNPEAARRFMQQQGR